MGGAPRCGLRSSGSCFGRGWSSRDRRMEQQGPMLGGSRLGTKLETSLTSGGQEMTTTHKVHLPPAHTIPLTISQVWVLPRGSQAGLRPFNHFSCPLLSLLPCQTHMLARLGLVHPRSRTLLLSGGDASQVTTHGRALSPCMSSLHGATHPA